MVELRKVFEEFDVQHKDSVFKCKQLSEIELEKVNYLTMHALKDGLITFPPDAITFILSKCLLDWSNVSSEGKQVVYKKGEEEFLPFKVRSDLALSIYAHSNLTDDEKKTSPKPTQ